ncbi:alpha/beta hydrolase fold-3 domain-containing protein [Poronia punctata]|nr:alpha/beta hydrolase fold-3 domain-containing protein [Poronia punctata]
MPPITHPTRPLPSYPILNILYRILYTGTILARVPWWILRYTFFRQHSTWTFRQAFMMNLFTELVYVDSRVEKHQPLSLDPGKEKDCWTRIPPFPEDMYKGPLQSEVVKPATIGGTWFPCKPAATGDMTGIVIMHIHGGGFVLGDGRKDNVGFLAQQYLDHCGEKIKIEAVFSPQYRLSSRPTCAPFPAALQDVLTSYLYLVQTLSIPPDKIVLAGDSAGGNLAIGLLRYFSEFGSGSGQNKIPLPRCSVLVAPWTSPVKHLWPEVAMKSNPNFGTDYLGIEFCRWGAGAYVVGHNKPLDDPYITPLGHAFSTPVPIFVALGALEILAIDGKEWVDEMRREDRGNVLELFVEDGAPHDTLLVGWVVGFEESARRVVRRVGKFIEMYSTS